MKDAYKHRLPLVQSARQRGIKPTARLFQTTVPTVRKWLRRYAQQGPRGLLEGSRAPHQLYFNLVRPNSHKQNLSPWQITEQLEPRSPLQLCLLPSPVFLDYYLNRSGGYDLPRLL